MLRLARAEEVQTQVSGPAGDPVGVRLERSGSVHWQYGESGNGWELVLGPALALLNVLSHYVLWRRGWLIRVDVDDKRGWRRRFRSRAAGRAALPAILATLRADGIEPPR